MDIPVELFLGFIGISLVMVGISLAKQIPAIMVFGGMFMLIWVVVTDNIIMGKIPTTSTVSGSVTTYDFEDNLFPLTDWGKVIFSLFAVIMMLVGALITKMSGDSP